MKITLAIPLFSCFFLAGAARLTAQTAEPAILLNQVAFYPLAPKIAVLTNTEPVPGLLAGGPNPGKQDKCEYAFSEPETTYADVDCSYASNEIAINWNAPLVYLVNAIEALQSTAGYAK